MRKLNHDDVRAAADGEDAAASFRLRLYWEKGYLWQDTPDEMWWCMGEFLSAGDLIRARGGIYATMR